MKKTIREIIDYSIRVIQPEKIILFGSMATKTNNVHSDLDLLVITEEVNSKKYFQEKVQNFAKELSLRTDILIYSPSEIEKECQKPYSFIGAIIKGGNIVYLNGNNLEKN